MLAESIDRWNREIREEGREEGRQEGLQEGLQKGLQKGLQEGEAKVVLGLLRLKFGILELEVEDRVRSADSEHLLLWAERVLTAGTLEEVFQD